MMFKTLIVIPARSGSKGILNKNIRKLGEFPLLCWTAKAVNAAEIEDALVILSTDSEKYANIGKQCGLTVPFIRPEQYAKNHTTAIDTLKHSIDWFKQEYGYLVEKTMWLQPTSPFRSPDIIYQALKLFDQKEVDSVIGCKTIDRNLTTLFEQKNGYLKPLSSDQEQQTRRQDITPLLTPNGAMYLTKTNIIVNKGSFYARKTIPLPMNTVMSHDIDEEEDWVIAQAYVDQKLDWMSELKHE